MLLHTLYPVHNPRLVGEYPKPGTVTLLLSIGPAAKIICIVGIYCQALARRKSLSVCLSIIIEVIGALKRVCDLPVSLQIYKIMHRFEIIIIPIIIYLLKGSHISFIILHLSGSIKGRKFTVLRILHILIVRAVIVLI